MRATVVGLTNPAVYSVVNMANVIRIFDGKGAIPQTGASLLPIADKIPFAGLTMWQ